MRRLRTMGAIGPSAATVPEQQKMRPHHALSKFNGNAALPFERPTLDGSHATHCAHRTGRSKHPPRAYRGVHHRRKRRPR